MQPFDRTALQALLHRIGLDEREAMVYLALLAIKAAPASVIAKEAKQQRSNTYLILRSLREKGLVSEIERGKVMHFVAEPPQRLIGYVQDREREMRDLQVLVEAAVPFLSSLTRPLTGKPRVTMVSGVAGMKQVYRDTLTRAFIGAFNVQRMYDLFGMTFVEVFFGKDATLHGRDLAVDNDAGRRYMREWQARGGHQVRLLPPGVTFEGDVIVFDDTIAFFAYDEEKTMVCVENRQLADTVRALLEILWTVSRAEEQVDAEDSA